MSEVTFSKQQKEEILSKLQNYFACELDSELAQFDAEFLLDFFTKEVGKYFYNQGIYDAQALLSKRIDVISDDIFSLEQ